MRASIKEARAHRAAWSRGPVIDPQAAKKALKELGAVGVTIILGLGLFTCCILPTCSVIHTLLNPSSLPSRESLEFPGYSVSEVERAREQMAAEAEAQREAAREAELRLRIEDEQRRARERR